MAHIILNSFRNYTFQESKYLFCAVLVTIVFFVVYRLLVTRSFKQMYLRKNNKSILFIPIFLGVIGWIGYVAFSKNKKSDSFKKITFFVMSAMFLAVVSIAFVNYGYNYRSDNSKYDLCSKVVYYDDYNVIYDKYGNEYKLNDISLDYDGNIDGFKYWDKNGNYYYYSYDRSSKGSPMYVGSDGTVYDSSDSFVDINGNFCIYDNDEIEDIFVSNEITVYNYNGTLLFNPYDCSWNKNGDMVFRSTELQKWVADNVNLLT